MTKTRDLADLGGGFIQAGTGATQRTVEDKLKDVVSVKDFGAVGDGTTDDTSAIQAAVTAATTVKFPKGTYKITDAIDLPVNAKLLGDNAVINVAYDGDGFNMSLGRGTGISATVSTTHDATTSNTFASNNTVITVSDTTGYAVGDLIELAGGGSSPQTFYAHVTAVTSTTLTVDDLLIYTISSATLYKLTPQYVEIDGLSMYHGVATPSASSYLIRVDGAKSLIKNCIFGHNTFTNSRCITATSYGSRIFNCKFNMVDLAIQLYDANNAIVESNSITNMNTAIRAVFCDSCQILNNDIQNGRNMDDGLGIELTATTSSYTKNCRNLVQGNTVIRAQKGVSGSGIGGIHLNFAAKYNRIIGNTSRHNSFGIYLENDCDYNVIDGNICSDNDGYYGVGIELDFNSNDNVISNNVCNNNRGSVTAKESSGIQIRDANANPCNRNTVIGNTCSENGLEGIRCGGNSTTVTGNILYNNAKDVVAMNNFSSDSKGWGIKFYGQNHVISDNIIYQNSYDSRATGSFCQEAIGYVETSGVTTSNIIITGNVITNGYYAKYAIRIVGSSGNKVDDVLIQNNTIKGNTAGGNAFNTQHTNDLYVNNNFIYQNSNGQPAFVLNTVDKFSIFGNVFNGPVSTISLASTTNRYTPADN